MPNHITIVGGGPAGLRAAEVVSATGHNVHLYDQKRSVGRKFLIAGKGGLNLTNAEDLEDFTKRYSGPNQPEDFWPRALASFDNKNIRGWAARLDVGTFVASSGRVYPKALKAAPLLRRWVQRLREQGVSFHMNHSLTNITREDSLKAHFGNETVETDAIILALGGGSWPQTGSDGHWTKLLEKHNITISPLTSANCGWEVNWPDSIKDIIEAQPLKNLTASAQGNSAIGEIMLTRYGIEGGPIYQLGPSLRQMASPAITLDLKPTFTEERLIAKMESAKRNFLREAELRWKLPTTACAILEHLYGPFDSATQLAKVVKSCTIPLEKPRPISEAISSAGGIAWTELDDSLMLKKLPKVFACGEMLDWEAPTGGYLLQGCFASGTLAAKNCLHSL